MIFVKCKTSYIPARSILAFDIGPAQQGYQLLILLKSGQKIAVSCASEEEAESVAETLSDNLRKLL